MITERNRGIAASPEMVAGVRLFNRTVTQRIGALQGRFLGRGRSLGASRLLYEIGGSGVDLRELRARLALDSGYMSRLLRSLDREGLVRVRRSPQDARARRLSLTAKGRGEVEWLNRLSDREAAAILEPLTEPQRTAITAAMETVVRLLTAGAVVIEIEDPSHPDAVACLDRYYRELSERFDAGFDPASSISATTEELTPPQGYFVVARLQGMPVGCGALKCHAEFGEVKRMWVAGQTRGLGIGRRILARVEELARQRQIPVLRLETNRSLTEAQALYRSSGYVEVPPFNHEPYAHHWFEKRLLPVTDR